MKRECIERRAYLKFEIVFWTHSLGKNQIWKTVSFLYVRCCKMVYIHLIVGGKLSENVTFYINVMRLKKTNCNTFFLYFLLINQNAVFFFSLLNENLIKIKCETNGTSVTAKGNANSKKCNILCNFPTSSQRNCKFSFQSNMTANFKLENLNLIYLFMSP